MVESVQELVARIVAATAEIRNTTSIFENIRSPMRRRCAFMHNGQGRNFEHLHL